VGEEKRDFFEKILDFGIFGVGVEVKKHATLRNTGKTELFFFVEKPEDTSSLSVTPMTGSIPPFSRSPPHNSPHPISLLVRG
jgi:hypothetical protein